MRVEGRWKYQAMHPTVGVPDVIIPDLTIPDLTINGCSWVGGGARGGEGSEKDLVAGAFWFRAEEEWRCRVWGLEFRVQG